MVARTIVSLLAFVLVGTSVAAAQPTPRGAAVRFGAALSGILPIANLAERTSPGGGIEATALMAPWRAAFPELRVGLVASGELVPAQPDTFGDMHYLRVGGLLAFTCLQSGHQEIALQLSGGGALARRSSVSLGGNMSAESKQTGGWGAIGIRADRPGAQNISPVVGAQLVVVSGAVFGNESYLQLTIGVQF